jgi:hypothetical protein
LEGTKLILICGACELNFFAHVFRHFDAILTAVFENRHLFCSKIVFLKGNFKEIQYDSFIIIFYSVNESYHKRHESQLSGEKQNKASLSVSNSMNFFFPEKAVFGQKLCTVMGTVNKSYSKCIFLTQKQVEISQISIRY